jgi:RNA polymerase sigma factor (sigma-70 family)
LEDPRSDLPHIDASRWQALVQAVGPSAMLVVIGSAMSKQLREHCTPEDIWQETLAHAWRDREQHRWVDLGAYRAWLFEIARNRIREAARGLAAQKRGAGRRTDRFSELPIPTAGSPSALLPGDSETPSRIVARGEKHAALEKALIELPPELAEIVRLHVLEEMTMESVAERLGIGLSAAWRRFRKGSDMLTRTVPGWLGDASTAAG